MKPILQCAVALFCIPLLFSCKKNDYVNTGAANGQVGIEFSNSAGSDGFNLGQEYTDQHGDKFTVNVFKYYVSNIMLTGPGVSYTEPNSYHLIDHNSPAGSTFNFTDMPYGQYNSITFTVGVDSTHNVAGPHTGALDPSNNMFLSATAGYVMLKLEGTSPISTQPGHAITFHPSGFWGPNTALRQVTVALSQPISVTGDVTRVSHVHVYADVLSIFKAPNVIDLSITNSVITPGPDVTKIADNYAGMFHATGSNP